MNIGIFRSEDGAKYYLQIRSFKAYGEIIDELRRHGYVAKAGTPFVRNSLHSILKNPKYTGALYLSRSAPKSFDGKRNGHKYKDDSGIIKVENGVPMIIPKEQFEIVQEMMKDRRQHNKRTSRYQPFIWKTDMRYLRL